MPTGSVDVPTGSVDVPTGSVDAPTGSVDAPTGSVDVSTDSVDVSTDSVDDLRERRIHEESELKKLKDSLEPLNRKSENLERKIDKFNDEAGLKRWLPETLGGSPLEKELVSAMEKQEEIEIEAASIRKLIEERQEVIACIDRKLDGESCDSFLDRLSDPKKAWEDTSRVWEDTTSQIWEDTGKVWEETSKAWEETSKAWEDKWWSNPSKIWEIVDLARAAAENMVMLLVVIVIKNIVIPLVFLMIVLKCSLPMVGYCMRLIPNMKQDVRKLRDAPEQKDRET